MTAFKLSPALWLTLDALAVMRLTVLVTRDIITDPIRKWIRDHLGLYWYDFITCPWCTSIWIATGVVAATVLIPQVWQYFAYLLTCSAVAAILTERT